MKITGSIVVVLLTGYTPNPGLKTTQYAGKYSYGRIASSGRAGELILFPESDSTMLFHLRLDRGAPSHNTGETYGRLTVRDDVGKYTMIDTLNMFECSLTFYFDKRKVIINYERNHDKCGYGFKVDADGEYRRKNKKVIPAFVDAGGNLIRFNAQTLAEWGKY